MATSNVRRLLAIKKRPNTSTKINPASSGTSPNIKLDATYAPDIMRIPHDPQKLCNLLAEYCAILRECSWSADKRKLMVGEKRATSRNNIQDSSALYTFLVKQIIEVASPILANSTGLPASLELELKVRLIEAKALLGHFDWEGNS